jgi:hypothetical protein
MRREEGTCGVDGGLKSLASLRFRPIHAKNRSTTQRRGLTAADLIGVLAYDLHRDQRGFGDLLAGITAAGEGPLDEREDAARSPQKRSAAVAILDARRMRFEQKATPVRVNERMALAPVDFLSSVVTAWPAASSCLCALGVDDRTRRAGLASDPLPIEHDEGVIDPVEAAFVPKLCKPSIDRAPRGANRSAAGATGSPRA